MYPQSVELAVESVVNSLKETDFFNIEQVDPSYVREHFGKELFQQWLSGEEFSLTEDRANYLLQLAITSQYIDGMIERGLIGTVEDADGKELVYVTEKGKQAAAMGPDLDVLNRF